MKKLLLTVLAAAAIAVSAQAQMTWFSTVPYTIQSFAPHRYAAGTGDVSRWSYSWERCRVTTGNSCSDWSAVLSTGHSSPTLATLTINAGTNPAGERWLYRRCSTNNDCAASDVETHKRDCTGPIDIHFILP